MVKTICASLLFLFATNATAGSEHPNRPHRKAVESVFNSCLQGDRKRYVKCLALARKYDADRLAALGKSRHNPNTLSPL